MVEPQRRGTVTIPRVTIDRPKEPLLIRIDSREQLPICCWPKGVLTERATLSVGDYDTPSLAGVAAIERKSPGDLMSSLTHDRERFDRELERAERLDSFAIVVEDSLDHCLALTAADWRSVVGSLASFAARGFGCCFLGSRLAAGRFIAGLLRRWETSLLPRKTPSDLLAEAANRLGIRQDRAQSAWMASLTAPWGGDPDPNDPWRTRLR